MPSSRLESLLLRDRLLPIRRVAGVFARYTGRG
jgi:hypothetical protein